MTISETETNYEIWFTIEILINHVVILGMYVFAYTTSPKVFFFPVKRVRIFFLNILSSYIFYQKFVGRLILIFSLYELNYLIVRNAAVLKS